MTGGGRRFTDARPPDGHHVRSHTNTGGVVSVCSLLSSEPIYTREKGSAASLYCLKQPAPAGKDGGGVRKAVGEEAERRSPVRPQWRVMMSKQQEGG